MEGAQLHEERVRSEASADSGARRSEEGAGPGTGRVVVEIKQPPRRGRGAGRGGPRGGTRSAGGERGDGGSAGDAGDGGAAS
jgi:hypothetical protein